MDKKGLIAQFQKNWKKYWQIRLFKEKGFKRQKCTNCKKFFWSLVEQKRCNDAGCKSYEFIGKPIGKKRNYFQAWKSIEKFFVKRGHHSLERYPVLCKWFPIYFTIAGVVGFYRKDGNKFMFELPKNPAIMLQPSLRFNDIPQVGVSGRHWTCHSHIEQASLWDGKNGYWKDKCIELDFDLLTKVFSVPETEINFIEDAWLGPGAFGSSLEYHVQGLELGNAVFTEFSGTPDNFQVMKKKLIDMGAGLERFCWLSQGTSTSYESVMGPVINKIIKKSGIKYDKKFFLEYSKLAGTLNLDEIGNMDKERGRIAKVLGISKKQLIEKVGSMQAVYSMADHSRALAFAIADNGLPSNIGGGYNLRVILRRALSFIDQYDLGIDLIWSIRETAKYFKPLHPELLKSMWKVEKILDVEEKRFKGSKRRVEKIIEAVIKKKGKLTENKIVELYDSQGIDPRLLKERAEKHGLEVELPADLYAKVTEKHMKKEEEVTDGGWDILDLPETKKLFYGNEKGNKFTAKILKVIGKAVVLDQTYFYPRGGGQEPDHGILNGEKVFDVEEQNGVILHFVEGKFKDGDKINGEIDMGRRSRIIPHHSATHLIEAASKKVLGPWIWQAGSKKDIDKAHVDATHYEKLTQKEIVEIEKIANSYISQKLPVKKRFMARPKAEEKFGFTIYQGAPVPKKELRIVSFGDIDHEACGGLHVDNTKEIGLILITKIERPADGTIRFIYKAGPAAFEHLEKRAAILKESAKLLGVKEKDVPKAVKKLFLQWKKSRKGIEKKKREKARKLVEKMEFVSKNGLEILVKSFWGTDIGELREISRKLSRDNTVILLFGVNNRIDVFGSAGKTAVDKGIDIGSIIGNACKELDGGGGGRPGLGEGIGRDKDKLKSVITAIKNELIG